MKKILSIILALAMALSMSVTAFAATNDGTSGTDITVNGTYTPGTAADEKISVDIVWEAMNFTYTAPSQGTWNPATHAYEGATEGGWSDNTPAITVKNHSNVAVNATLGFTADAEVGGSGGSGGNFRALGGGKLQNLVICSAAGFGEGTDYAGNIGFEAQSGVHSDIGMVFDGDAGSVIRPAACCCAVVSVGSGVPCTLRCACVGEVHSIPHNIHGDLLRSRCAGDIGAVYGDIGTRCAVIRCRKGCDGQGQRHYKRKNNR